jgi:DNA-binding GntR family transcriptional regulator
MKDIAYNFIKNKIMNNEFESGQYLEEKYLCDLIGVSRTPIREAINQLAMENFVEVFPNKGIHVTLLDLNKTKELFEARYYLEPLILELAWENLNVDVLAEYEEKTINALNENNTHELNEIDYELHNYINENCKNSFLINIANSLSDQFQRVRTLDFYNADRIVGGAKEHLELIKFVKENKKNKALDYLRIHISNTRKYFFLSFIEN